MTLITLSRVDCTQIFINPKAIAAMERVYEEGISYSNTIIYILDGPIITVSETPEEIMSIINTKK